MVKKLDDMFFHFYNTIFECDKWTERTAISQRALCNAQQKNIRNLESLVLQDLLDGNKVTTLT